MAGENNEAIVIVRRAKGSHDAHHGGSWKVAFADFAIAMMALFLVLWLIAATTPVQKKAIATYFSDPGLYNRTGTSTPIELQGSTTLIESTPVYLKPSPSGRSGLEISGQGAPGMDEASTVSTHTILALTQTARNRKAAGKLQTRLLPKSVILVVTQPEEGPMFQAGSTQISPYYEDLLIALVPALNQLNVKLIISGHSSASPDPEHGDNNRESWQLSSQRAEAVREILTFAGLPPEQVLQLNSMGDTIPLDNQAPDSPLNRRVDILILTKKSEKLLKKQLHPSHKANSVPDDDLHNAKQEASENEYTK